MPFSIVGLKDLNRFPSLQKPLETKDEKTFGALFWKSKPLTATLTINKQAFVSGEKILVSGIIDNQSDVMIKHCELKILKKEVFKAGADMKVFESVVKTVIRPEIEVTTKMVWNNVPVRVPCLPPSGLNGCSIIGVYYTLQVRIVPCGAHFSLELNFRFVIGTIPFKQKKLSPKNSNSLKETNNNASSKTLQSRPSAQVSAKPSPKSKSSPTPVISAPSGPSTSSMVPPNSSPVRRALESPGTSSAPQKLPSAPNVATPSYETPGPSNEVLPSVGPGEYFPSDLHVASYEDYCSGGDAPPSYESLFKSEGSEYDDDVSRSYIPKYPSYNIQPSVPPNS